MIRPRVVHGPGWVEASAAQASVGSHWSGGFSAISTSVANTSGIRNGRATHAVDRPHGIVRRSRARRSARAQVRKRQEVEAQLQHFAELDPYVAGRPGHTYFVRSLYTREK